MCFRIVFASESNKGTECTSENSSEVGSSRVSGVRVSGAAKTFFVNEMEGLLRTQEPMPPCVEGDGSSETFCLEEEEVGLTKEGNMNEVTEETAIEFSGPRIDLSSSSCKDVVFLFLSFDFEGYPIIRNLSCHFLIDEMDICRKPI
ncbi:hypothetical protein F2Q70_00023521 [Brassica cretica]|uniref:Uncharacterized protein n=1 Tax=Brassica cretica TaxID=69181 RepID=A0A8S9GHH7_BRACR|nr:hypothetical protein F2Q70_00023521 [Brassica cretica]